MEKEYNKQMMDNTFPAKKDWIWIVILLLGVIAVIFAIYVDIGKIDSGRFVGKICKAEVRNVLWQSSETMSDIIVTYSTVLAAIVVFFYSMIDKKRLGVPYRRLISYTIGSRTIPVLFMTALLLTIVMKIVWCFSMKYTVFMCMGYIFMIQIFVIIQILASTSYRHCKRVICRIERKRYLKGVSLEGMFNTEWAYFFCHLERAVHSEEFIPDKKEFLAEFLWIPFCRQTGELNKIVASERELTEKEELERVYQFYYVNILSAFQNFNGEARHSERNQLYQCIVDFVLQLSDRNRDHIVNDRKVQYVYHMILSGILNGLMASNVEDNVGVCSYILSKCITDAYVGKKQLALFVLFQEVLSMIDIQNAQRRIRVRDIGQWESVESRDVGFYAEFWDIWTKIYDFTFVEKVWHFEAAMQTMTGRRNASAPILRMLLVVTGKDNAREKNNG